MKTSKITFLGLFTALAMILSFVETLLPPITTAFPGIKMGLPNIAIMFILYRIGWKEATLVSIVRVILVSILFGSVMSMAYSLAGAALSLLVMTLMQKFTTFNKVSISVLGGVCHNVGQVLVAWLITDTAQIVYYLPVLLISGSAAGILVGLGAGMLEKRVPKIKF
jgi:heptaprenyl diphosphate synthase